MPNAFLEGKGSWFWLRIKTQFEKFCYRCWINLFGKDVRIISNLYWEQTACRRIENKLKIERGVRQGCIFSPNLFNLYSDDSPRELADSKRKPEELLDRLVEESEKKGLNVNYKKTNYDHQQEKKTKMRFATWCRHRGSVLTEDCKMWHRDPNTQWNSES